MSSNDKKSFVRAEEWKAYKVARNQAQVTVVIAPDGSTKKKTSLTFDEFCKGKK